MMIFFFFFFNDTATTEIYTLSLHDALPISRSRSAICRSTESSGRFMRSPAGGVDVMRKDRKSTRLNSSHGYISYAVFCLKKKKIKKVLETTPNTECTYKPTNRIKRHNVVQG